MNFTPLDLDEIRPYEDAEIPAVLRELAQKPSFLLLVRYLFPDMSPEMAVQEVQSVRSCFEFQQKFIQYAIRGMIRDSSDGLSFEGLKELDPATPYLFISNHRDIILDSALLNVLLFENQFDTTRIAIGDNLMISNLVTDLMKLNKSFIVHRNAPPHQLYAYSERLSRYIRQSIVKDRSSVWLAQRSGRAKDGKDSTVTGLLKMLNISGQGGSEDNFRELNLTPMAISYEFEPCDGLKTEEMVHKDLGIPYTKDDKEAMIRGIREYKGRMHLAIGKPFTGEGFTLSEGHSRSDWFAALTQWIDGQIHQLYHCFPSNYIAADLLRPHPSYAAQYSEEDASRFMAHMEARLATIAGPQEALRQRFLEIYANPVFATQ